MDISAEPDNILRGTREKFQSGASFSGNFRQSIVPSSEASCVGRVYMVPLGGDDAWMIDVEVSSGVGGPRRRRSKLERRRIVEETLEAGSHQLKVMLIPRYPCGAQEPSFVIALPGGMRIRIEAGVTDMRRGFHSLSARSERARTATVARSRLRLPRSQRRHRESSLGRWRRLCLLAKHLERGRFVWPQVSSASIRRTERRSRHRDAPRTPSGNLCGSHAATCLHRVLWRNVIRTRRRKKEFGTRLALGTTLGHVQALIVSQTGPILLAGALPDAVISVLAPRTAGHLLYGSVNANALAIIVASVVLVLAGTVATLVPARRAAYADPSETLRDE